MFSLWICWSGRCWARSRRTPGTWNTVSNHHAPDIRCTWRPLSAGSITNTIKEWYPPANSRLSNNININYVVLVGLILDQLQVARFLELSIKEKLPGICWLVRGLCFRASEGANPRIIGTVGSSIRSRRGVCSIRTGVCFGCCSFQVEFCSGTV